jgi:HK97 family phage portal protein
MILATQGGAVKVRDASIGAVLAAEGALRGQNGGSAVTGQSIGGLPAADLAIRIASQAVAKLRRLDVWRGKQPNLQQVTGSWQARFFAGQPNERESWFDVFEQLEASLTARNNGYWWKLRDAAGRVGAVYTVHPDNVGARWNSDTREAEYRVRNDAGQWSDWLTAEDVLHFRVGYPEPGALVAPSPVQRFRDTFGAAQSKTRYESVLYDDGVLDSVAVTFPADVSPEQARQFRDMMKDQHGGVENRSKVRVFGGGATVQTIGLTPSDAQFIEAMNFDVQQIARIFGVTASLLGETSGAGSKVPPLPEHEESRWYRYGLEPRLARIEEKIRSDRSFFGPGSRDFPVFAANTIRADRQTEVAAYVSLVQAGIIVPDTAATELGYPPLPGGVGQIVQVTPVGGAPNPNLPADAPASTDGGNE